MDTRKRKKRLTKAVILLVLSVCTITRLFSDAYATGENTKSDTNEQVTGINVYSDTANTTDFAGGTGTKEDPYLVSTAAHFNNVRKFPSAYFKQTADIDLSGFSNFVPIERITGEYDGNGHTLNNITMSAEYGGIFQWIIGTVQNLGLLNGEIKGKGISGVLCHGIRENGKILNCYNKNVKISVDGIVGGFVGKLCDSPGVVIRNCYNQASVVSTTGGLTGGIVGTVQHLTSGSVVKATIENCYNTGSLSGEAYPMGCFSDGEVSVMNCYYDAGVIPNALDDGSIGIPTEQMKSSAFAEQLGEVYVYRAGNYPELDMTKTSSIKYIYTAEDFVAINQDPTGTYVQMDHIDLSGYPNFFGIEEFSGVYDGNGYTISNIDVSGPYSALFRILKNGILKNVGLLSGSVTSSTTNTSGVLVGIAEGRSVITECYNLSCIANFPSGGILVGKVYADSEIPQTDVLICNCYNQSSTTMAGYGIVRFSQNSGGNYARATVENCYSSGKVRLWPISDENVDIMIKNCYYDKTVMENVAAVTGVTGKTTEEMKDPNFPNQLGSAYIYKENGYPILANQRALPGENTSSLQSHAVRFDHPGGRDRGMETIFDIWYARNFL